MKKTRAIGVSNFNSYLLNKCINLGYKEILCNQVEYHPFLSQNKLIKTMGEENIELHVEPGVNEHKF